MNNQVTIYYVGIGCYRCITCNSFFFSVKCADEAISILVIIRLSWLRR